MRCRKIFNCAAALIAENPYDDSIDDLLLRACDIINTFIYNVYDVGNLYEQRVLNQPEPPYREVNDIDDVFPLCDDLAGVCIYYLASVLVNNENFDLSKKLESDYIRLLSDIAEKIPADIDSITNIY